MHITSWVHDATLLAFYRGEHLPYIYEDPGWPPHGQDDIGTNG